MDLRGAQGLFKARKRVYGSPSRGLGVSPNSFPFPPSEGGAGALPGRGLGSVPQLYIIIYSPFPREGGHGDGKFAWTLAAWAPGGGLPPSLCIIRGCQRKQTNPAWSNRPP